MIKEITKQHIKLWVVKTASVNNPHKKKWWYASVTIGYDYAEKGETIEVAYTALADRIYKSPHIVAQLKDFPSFKEIWRNN